MRADLSKKRAFLISGHAHCGKTMLAENILFKCGAISRLGKVEEGTTVSDYGDDEKERCSSINLSVLNAEYKGNFLQFIDTPGFFDFIGELICAARTVDFAIIVVDAVSGVGVGTEKAWEIVRKENLPCLFFISKLDKENTSFANTLKDIQDSLAKKAIPFSEFCAPARGGCASGAKGGKDKKIIDILKEKSQPYYGQITETVAESDDALLEKYLENGCIEEKEFIPALKKAIANSQIFPVFSGIATDGLGTELLIEQLCEIMPSAQESVQVKKVKEEIAIEPKIDAPLAAFVFKTVIDPYVGQLNIFRVFSGKIASNSEVFNSTKGVKEKIGQLYILQGKQQIAQEEISAGEIAAVAKLKDTSGGDTFCQPAQKLEFCALEFPPPAFSASVKPKTREDEDKISNALSRLTSEDPTFKVSRDAQTSELIISGMGELHLNVIIERMKKRYEANVELGTPKVPYKETITKSVKVQGKYKKQTGGRGQYGDVWIEVEPLERGKNFEFVNKIVGGAIPRNYIPSAEKGIRNAMTIGILVGYPIIDIKVTIYDGSYHPVDSSDIAFQIAGSMALKKALEQAGSVLLEPIMDVEIAVPEEFMGQVTGDINAKRGRVMGVEVKGKNQVVKAQVPLSEMFKYASDLRSVTGGRGFYAMSFSHNEIVPARIAQGIIEKVKQEKKE